MIQINKLSTIVLTVSAFASILGGCNAGMAPEGGSPDEVKAAFDAQPLDVRARQVMSSPAPQDYKIQRVKDMYQKEGKEVPADILKGGGAMPGAAPAPSKGP